MKPFSVFALVCLVSVVPKAWHNGGDTAPQPPKYGAHDYIAFKGLDRAPKAKVAFIRQNLTAYFIGTEAPDTNKKIPGVTEGGYKDAIQCHCILFDKDGNVTQDHARVRIRQEFDRASAALAAGKMAQAAFFAGAMAHYVGDLSQFCHVMGEKSHWGAEDQKIHAAYEDAVDKRVDYTTRGSVLLDPFLKKVSVPGTTPEKIAEAVAMFTEHGGGTAQTPGWMIGRLTAMGRAKTIGDVESWSPAFRTRTGVNVNYSINAVGKLLAMLGDEE